jgi:DNA polymerase family A
LPVFDTEGDGFTPTKFHVLSYYDEENKCVVSLTNHDDMRDWVVKQEVLVAHNGVGFDKQHLERILGIKVKALIIDTLALSWYLYPERKLHGLESWGVTYNIPKPYIEDWYNLPVERYVHRCEQDVLINQKLWEDCQSYLSKLYQTNSPEELGIVRYLSFKMECAYLQEKSRWKLDREWTEKALEKLEAEKLPKFEALKLAMPKVEKRVLKSKPAKPYKKDGTLSVEGAKWFAELARQGLPKAYEKPVSVVTSLDEPNPNSPEQIKEWLYSLGWEPVTFKFVKEDDGSERKIPQTKLPQSPNLCASVLELREKSPAIEELQGLSVINHRLGLLKGFLKNADSENFLRARVHGLTNTLRFKHTEIVNLPGVAKPYGLEVRGALVARPKHELIGTDMVSLEDTTKRHYMYAYDPEYVIEMSDPRFDPHLDLAVFANAISKADYDYYTDNKKNEEDPLVKKVVSIRKQYKVVNYSAVYGVGPPKLARELKSSVTFAKQLLEGYWKRNWAVRKVAEDCVVKTVNGQKWLFNPVSKFWYSLRYEKDRFSTLNQGTGVYCFDSWVKECLKRRNQLTAQFHDETISEEPEGNFEKVKALQLEAIAAVNRKLQLNVTLGVEPKVGKRYSDIH